MLHRELAGREITGGPAALVGDRVANVDALGKHLLIHFTSGRILHSHMRMTGRWQVFRGGKGPRRAGGPVRVVLEAGDRVAVCFNAPVVELLAAKSEHLHPWLSSLGPDILADPLDTDGIVERTQRCPAETEIGDVLLDQQVVCGIGNIWRSETLFVSRLHPRRTLVSIDRPALCGCFVAASRLMKSAVRSNCVYQRARRPCLRCGTAITSARMGVNARTAYWCPRCQRCQAGS